MTIERKGAVTFKGNPLTVLGHPLGVGDRAPEVALNTDVFEQKYLHLLADTAGKVRLVNVVPSLATGICDAQTHRFNKEVAALGAQVAIITISADLPFAQANWCAAAGIDKAQMASDHMDMAFGNAYGTHIQELRLEQRAVFVIDKEDIVRYVEYVPEIAQHPNYDAALAALNQILQSSL